MIAVLLAVALVAVGFFIMVTSTKWLVESMRTLSDVLPVGRYGLAVFLLGLSTSLPELMVSVVSGIEGASDLALGNVVGSNIANLSLVVGGAALVAWRLKASDSFLREQVAEVFLISTAPFLLFMDGRLGRFEGMMLILMYGVYIMRELHSDASTEAVQQMAYVPMWRRILVTLHKPRVERSIVFAILGAVGLVMSAELVVKNSLVLASLWRIPDIVVGVFVVALGTSLPELVTEITAVKRREVSMAFGNILGSVVVNSTLVLGVAAVIAPIQLNGQVESFWIAVVAYVLIFGLFWRLVWTKHRLDWWEGLVLLVVYLGFTGVELLH